MLQGLFLIKFSLLFSYSSHDVCIVNTEVNASYRLEDVLGKCCALRVRCNQIYHSHDRYFSEWKYRLLFVQLPSVWYLAAEKNWI